ncbi:MAG: 16S rRNA (guanine(966)-N(2))-methyltransferase RsmD [bacterium]|nr:16S rRNA (guanine(966)-N(2))-methyltransferase RsmD [bacterium]
MRIIAGQAKGRKLRRPVEGTRPFTDRNREALFSSLGNLVDGAAVLDLYAGVGSLGLEALSRGADDATFVEWHPPAVAVLRENVLSLGLGGEVVSGDVFDFLRETRDLFDLVFVDPPYDLPAASVEDVLEQLGDQLKPSGQVVVHRRFGESAPRVPADLELVWERRYGDAQIWRFSKGTQQ